MQIDVTEPDIFSPPKSDGLDREFRTEAGVGGALVYAVGDVHGCYDLFKLMLARLTADAAERAGGRRPVLILCGDYIDRGPDSAKVVQALVWMSRRSEFEIHLLKGNHEQAMLAFLDDPEAGRLWLEFGGRETLVSYGVEAFGPDPSPAELARVRDDLLDRMPGSHLRLLERLELAAVVGDYAFVHAGVRPGVSLRNQTEQDLLWIRRGFLDAPGPFEKIVVHGHTWRDDMPQLLENRIGIDTGAYATGVLTALRLEDGRMEVLRTRGPVSP
jgi:serine/threonine protein phosphatase 1